VGVISPFTKFTERSRRAAHSVEFIAVPL